MAISEMASFDDQHRCQRHATYVVPLQTYSVDQWVTGCEVIISDNERQYRTGRVTKCFSVLPW
jgi:hypothetical protein